MEVLRSEVDVEAFFQRFRHAGPGLLLLDYDGTLAPFREERNQARPWPGVRSRLGRIRGARGPAPVVISGRPVREVAELLGTEPAPEIWGCHGWEHRSPEGEFRRIAPGAEVAAALDAAHRWAVARLPDDRVEHKGAAVAVHLRGLEEDRVRRTEAQVSAAWKAVVGENPALDLHPFDGGLEVRAAARDKGTAVRELLAQRAPDVPVAYLGDDRTDEDAFEAVREARGLAVLVRDQLRPTEADIRLTPPGELLGFLDRWLDAVRET